MDPVVIEHQARDFRSICILQTSVSSCYGSTLVTSHLQKSETVAVVRSSAVPSTHLISDDQCIRAKHQFCSSIPEIGENQNPYKICFFHSIMEQAIG